MDKKQKLWLLLKQMPLGKVTTYKILPERLRTHPRAVGKMLNSNQHPIDVPCHRVVHSDGGIGGYRLGTKRKVEFLKKEGVKIEKRSISLKEVLFDFSEDESINTATRKEKTERRR
jgi:methylated-DNA-[protein]-cysteine S-methyltransferase